MMALTCIRPMLLTLMGVLAGTATAWAACTGPDMPTGAVFYNTSYNVIQYCNGSNWVNAGPKNPSAANGGCSNPSGTRGMVIFNTTANVHQFCNGEQWMNMACSATATSGGTACSNPAAPRGALAFVTPANKLQMCDGTNWLNAGMPCGPESGPPVLALYCWGQGSSGQLGNGNTSDAAQPIPVSLPSGVTGFRVASNGQSFACGVGSDNLGYCWGFNNYGQHGNGTTNTSSLPVQVTSPAGTIGFKSIVASANHSCGFASNSAAYCWGYNASGQLGNGSTANARTPVAVALPSGVARFKSIALGVSHGCGIGSDNRAYCWGNGYAGIIGDGTTNNYSTPQAVTLPAGVSSFTQIASGNYHNCAIANTGQAYCWGQGDNGAMGNGAKNSSYTPTQVTMPSGATSFKFILGGASFSCGIVDNGKAYCWGTGSYGELGSPNTQVLVPTQVTFPSGVTAFTSLATSSGSLVCGIANNNRAYCWGKNNAGQLGNGTVGSSDSYQYVPQAVVLPAGKTMFSAVSANDVNGCALIK